MTEWIKRNKIWVIFILLISYFLVKFISSFFGINLFSTSTKTVSKSAYPNPESINLATDGQYYGLKDIKIREPYSPAGDYTPQTDTENRLVIKESNMSLLVKNVTDARNKIVEYAQKSGGYMVSSSVSNPQDTPSATVVIRIPSEKLEESLEFFRSLSVKVVSENLLGQDVTDQYIDIDKHILQLERSKARLEEILEKAENITDITNLTQQIINYQNQIDSYKGQQDYLEKNAQLAKLTIYISTDEIALPYTPSETFRPAVILKLAVRSLIKTLRGLATLGIWIGVYAVIWVPTLGVYIFLKKWLKKRNLSK